MSKYEVFSGPYFPAFRLNKDQKKLLIWTFFHAVSPSRCQCRVNFWTTCQWIFFDVKVFNLFARRHSKISVEKCCGANENEKKKSYGNQVLQIENGSFTPLVFAANGGLGKESIRFYFSKCDQICSLTINGECQFRLLQTILGPWYAFACWDPRSDAREVRKVQDIHTQKTLISRSMHWLKLIKWNTWYKLEFCLRIYHSSWGAHEDKISADKGFNCHTFPRFV